MNAIGFAIVGTGEAARTHAAALAECSDTRLVTCVSRRPDAARRFALEFKCRGETDLDAMLSDSDVDAVIVATEPERHDVAIPIARSGRHVLIEKPLALSWEAGVAIAQACAEAKVTASVVSQRRFDGAYERLRGGLADGVIGAPVFAEFTHLASRSDDYFTEGNGWRRGRAGGVTMNLLIHGIDRLLGLLGGIRRLHADLAPTPTDDRPDRRASLLLVFERDVHAVVRGSTEFGRSWGEMLSISGEKGTLVMQNGAVRVLAHPLGVEGRLSRARRLAGDLLPPRSGASRASPRGPLARQVEDFVTAMRTGSPPSVTLDDGLAALRVVLAAHESHATGRMIVLAPEGAA